MAAVLQPHLTLMPPATNSGEVHEGGLALRWRRFRSLEDTGWLQIRPITVLLGANNAGKSSVLAPLRLLKQSLASETGRSALLMTGPLADLGTFSDIVLGHDPESTIEMGLRWHDHRNGAAARHPSSVPPGSLSLVFAKGVGPHQVALQRYRVYNYYRQQVMLRTRRASGTYSLSMPSPPETPETSAPNLAGRKALRSMKRAMRADTPVDFLFRSSRVIRAAFAERRGGHGDFVLPVDPEIAQYVSITEYVEMRVEDLFESMHYIGPLREPPRRVYELSGEMPANVGTRGEFTPEILYRWRGNKSRLAQVQDWLSEFGFDESLRWEEYGETAYGMFLCRKQGGPGTSFLDIGFGMSQAPPLIVQCIRARPEDRLIVEQPEIHLNPALQAKLADLFVDAAGREVSVLVETHSEHLLLRLRRLIAEKRIASDDVALYFVERDGDISTVRQIETKDNGYIAPTEWPRGFFEDALRESLGLARAQAHAD